MNQSVIDRAPDPAKAEWEMSALHPLGRMGEPREIGAVAAFLLSDEASFLSGECIAVDGAATARCYPYDPDPRRGARARVGLLLRCAPGPPRRVRIRGGRSVGLTTSWPGARRWPGSDPSGQQEVDRADLSPGSPDHGTSIGVPDRVRAPTAAGSVSGSDLP